MGEAELPTALADGLAKTCSIGLSAQNPARDIDIFAALTLYGTVGIGAPATLLTLASGPLYAHFGAHGFWVMAALCAAALPLARTLREPFGKPT